MENNTPYDWSKFTRRITVRSSFDTIYKSWATTAGLEKWFLRKANFRSPEGTTPPADEMIKPGFTYEWFWFGWGDEVVERGEILAANGKDHFRFVFGKAGIVDVKIKTEEGETLVELTQEGIPTDEKSRESFHLGCSVGWTFYLANLKSILEGGIDLRNKNVKIKSVSNC